MTQSTALRPPVLYTAASDTSVQDLAVALLDELQDAYGCDSETTAQLAV